MIFLKSLLKHEFSFVRGSFTMHFIYMCDRTCAVVFHEAYFVLFLWKLSVLQYAKEINFFLFPPFGVQMMTKACNRLKRRDSI